MPCQNNQHAKVAYLGMACSAPLRDQTSEPLLSSWIYWIFQDSAIKLLWVRVCHRSFPSNQSATQGQDLGEASKFPRDQNFRRHALCDANHALVQSWEGVPPDVLFSGGLAGLSLVLALDCLSVVFGNCALSYPLARASLMLARVPLSQFLLPNVHSSNPQGPRKGNCFYLSYRVLVSCSRVYLISRWLKVETHVFFTSRSWGCLPLP